MFEWKKRVLWRVPLLILTGDNADKYASVYMLWVMSHNWSATGWQDANFVDAFTFGTDPDPDMLAVRCLTLSNIEGVQPSNNSWISGLIRARINSPQAAQTILTMKEPRALKRLTDDVRDRLEKAMVIPT